MDQNGKLLEGVIIFAVLAVLTVAGAYVMWPADFFSTAFADMTPAMLLRATLSLALAIAGLEFLGALTIIALSER